MAAADQISEAIQKISQRRHVISAEARRAKEELDQRQPVAEPIRIKKTSAKKLAVIEEFNKSIKLLTSIFEESNFDDLAMFISHPGRILIINFFIGILRGIGFAVGVLLIIFLLTFLIRTSVSPALLKELLSFVRTLNG